MRVVGFGLLILLTAPPAMAGSTFGVEGLSLKAGTGYEFLSQDFYLDSLDRAGADSLDISTTLKTTYLDDLKGLVRFGYAPFQNHRLQIDGSYEQTADQQRARAYLNHAFGVGPFRIDWQAEGDFRDGEVDPSKGDPGYISGNERLRIALPVADRTSLWARARADQVRFDSAGDGAFDYSRAGIEMGITQYTGDFSVLTGSGFYLRRFVPDAASEDYRSTGANLSFLGSLVGSDLDLSIHYESRDYNRPANLDDYRRGEIILRDRRSLGGSFFLREEFEIEILSFDTTIYSTSDYSRWEAAVLVGTSASWGDLALGPHLSRLSETRVDPYTVSEDYREYGIKTQYDLIQPGSLLLSLESVTGRRDLVDEGSTEVVQTDFTFERLSLLADWLTFGRLGFNALLSSEWEWHENSSENTRLVLFSSSLTWSF